MTLAPAAPAKAGLSPANAEWRSVSIPFAGFYETPWSDAVDQEGEHIRTGWEEDPAVRDADLPGFAGLALEELERELAARQTSLAELLIDATDYGLIRRRIVAAYAAAYADWIAETLDRDSIPVEFEALDSPRYYNFETDRLFARFRLDDLRSLYGRLLASDGGPGILADVIRERHTTSSGFVSYYSNDPADWLCRPLAEWDHNELGTLLYAWDRLNGIGRLGGGQESRRRIADSIDEHLYGELYAVVEDAVSRGVDWARLAARSREIGAGIEGTRGKRRGRLERIAVNQ